MSLFKGDAHSLWMQQSSVLKQSVQHLEHLSDIEALRASFIEVSKSMIAIAESFGPITTPVYIQHCPMAYSNKGADWLSNKEEILNPYFGQAMLTCGEVTKTID
jgi:Cu(I)/Ag(I) efflux system membrane fusion protein